MTKIVLFVSYGGGHARMVTPVIRALESYPDIHSEALALTIGGPIFKSEGLPYKGYRDFVTGADAEALAWGKRLAAKYHSPESGVSEAEAIAYLGLSYWDLVLRHGEVEAAQLLERKGRHAFFPLAVMERVIHAIKPSMVVTTNSPRSEQAAVAVARQHGIPTLSMVDLFGLHHMIPLAADYITVMSERIIANLLQDGVNRPRDAFLITGNPAFDQAFDFSGPIDHAWRYAHFPYLPAQTKMLLWADTTGYRSGQSCELHLRNKAEIIEDLELLSQAARMNDACLLIRPHPSQPRTLYEEWIRHSAYPHVGFAGDVPLYPLLKSVDAVATYGSTVAVEALLMRRPVIQLQKQSCSVGNPMPMADWGLAWSADGTADLPGILHQVLNSGEAWDSMRARIAELLPQDKAAPKIAYHIHRIACSGTR
jgi:hypothetical protein